jgi:predicted small lipoprotein YifL
MQSSIGMPARMAVIAALVAVLGLAGCGRKAGLDAPPGAAAPQRDADGKPENVTIGPDGKVVETPVSPRKRLPVLDWLIN